MSAAPVTDEELICIPTAETWRFDQAVFRQNRSTKKVLLSRGTTRGSPVWDNANVHSISLEPRPKEVLYHQVCKGKLPASSTHYGLVAYFWNSILEWEKITEAKWCEKQCLSTHFPDQQHPQMQHLQHCQKQTGNRFWDYANFQRILSKKKSEQCHMSQVFEYFKPDVLPWTITKLVSAAIGSNHCMLYPNLLKWNFDNGSLIFFKNKLLSHYLWERWTSRFNLRGKC